MTPVGQPGLSVSFPPQVVWSLGQENLGLISLLPPFATGIFPSLESNRKEVRQRLVLLLHRLPAARAEDTAGWGGDRPLQGWEDTPAPPQDALKAEQGLGIKAETLVRTKRQLQNWHRELQGRGRCPRRKTPWVRGPQEPGTSPTPAGATVGRKHSQKARL